jgi:hypothetical protein
MAADTLGGAAWDEVPFFKGQKKIVLRNCGLINLTTSRSLSRSADTKRVAQGSADGSPETVNEQPRWQAARPRGRGGGLLDRIEI